MSYQTNPYHWITDFIRVSVKLIHNDVSRSREACLMIGYLSEDLSNCSVRDTIKDKL